MRIWCLPVFLICCQESVIAFDGFVCAVAKAHYSVMETVKCRSTSVCSDGGLQPCMWKAEYGWETSCPRLPKQGMMQSDCCLIDYLTISVGDPILALSLLNVFQRGSKRKGTETARLSLEIPSPTFYHSNDPQVQKGTKMICSCNYLPIYVSFCGWGKSLCSVVSRKVQMLKCVDSHVDAF